MRRGGRGHGQRGVGQAIRRLQVARQLQRPALQPVADHQAVGHPGPRSTGGGLLQAKDALVKARDQVVMDVREEES